MDNTILILINAPRALHFTKKKGLKSRKPATAKIHVINNIIVNDKSFQMERLFFLFPPFVKEVSSKRKEFALLGANSAFEEKTLLRWPKCLTFHFHTTSQFRISNSEFRIPNSEFRILNSEFRNS